MTVVFLHVPKAGGTSLIEILAQQYGPHSTDHFHEGGVWNVTDSGLSALKKATPAKTKNIKCIHGHIPYGIHTVFPKGQVQYITMLRHPTDRIVSLFHYVSQLGGYGRDWWAGKGAYIDISILEFVSLDLPHVNNSQTRQFCGLPFRHEYSKAKVSKAKLNLAIKNLKGFAAVGVLEHFDKSIRLFGDTLGWSNPTSYLDQGKRKYNPNISPETVEIIEHKNQYDIELYKWAVGE